MDGLDWSNGKIEMISRSNFNPAQRIQKIDSFPNLFPQCEAAINAGSLHSSFQYNHPQNGPILDSGLPSPPLNLRSQAGVVSAKTSLLLDSGITSPPRDLLVSQPGVDLTEATDSLESIDCLLSASNTTTSIEDDDGISFIFSNHNTLWNNYNSAPVKFTNCGTPPQTSPHSHDENPIINIRNKRKMKGSQLNLEFSRQSDNHFRRPKRQIQEKQPIIASSNINFQQPSSLPASSSADEPDPEAIAHMKEIMYRAAAFRPVDFGTEIIEKPKRKNVRISSDPQTVAARERREKISERIRVLQRLVPGGSKMDTASMLDEAANYLKFLRSQVKALEAYGQKIDPTVNIDFPGYANLAFSSPFLNYSLAMQQGQAQFSVQSPNRVNQPKT